MRIERALNVRDEKFKALVNLYNNTTRFKWSFKKLQEERREVFKKRTKSEPQWINNYLRGADDLLRIQMERNLEFCYVRQGQILSVYNDSERYYEKLGFKPSEMPDLPSGRFWKETNKCYWSDNETVTSSFPC